MKGQSDLPGLGDASDFIRRIPTMCGFKPRDEYIVSMAAQEGVAWSSSVHPGTMDRLPEFVSQVRSSMGGEGTLVLTYCLPGKRDGTVADLVLEAIRCKQILDAPRSVDGLEVSFVVNWEAHEYISSACQHPGSGLGHPIEGTPYTLPGMTIYETEREWRASMADREDIIPTPDLLARAEVLMTNLANHPREMLTELATDPRGLDDAGVLALSRYITRTRDLEVGRTWLANGWNIDNLSRLVRCTSSHSVRSAVALTMAGDGFMAHAKVVSEQIPRGTGFDSAKTILETPDPHALHEVVEMIHEGVEEYRIAPVDLRGEGEID